jgi:hypothetical protein
MYPDLLCSQNGIHQRPDSGDTELRISPVPLARLIWQATPLLVVPHLLLALLGGWFSAPWLPPCRYPYLQNLCGINTFNAASPDTKMIAETAPGETGDHLGRPRKRKEPESPGLIEKSMRLQSDLLRSLDYLHLLRALKLRVELLASSGKREVQAAKNATLN